MRQCDAACTFKSACLCGCACMRRWDGTTPQGSGVAAKCKMLAKCLQNAVCTCHEQGPSSFVVRRKHHSSAVWRGHIKRVEECKDRKAH